jgi:hypothetical protein
MAKKKKKNMKGGKAGTSGNMVTLFDNIKGLGESIVDTIVDTTELVVKVFEIPGDMNRKIPYKQPNAPGKEL